MAGRRERLSRHRRPIREHCESLHCSGGRHGDIRSDPDSSHGGEPQVCHALRLSVAEIDSVHPAKMQSVARVFCLAEWIIHDMSDGQRERIASRRIDGVIAESIDDQPPHVQARGISGFPDHSELTRLIRTVAPLLDQENSPVRWRARFALTKQPTSSGAGLHHLTGTRETQRSPVSKTRQRVECGPMSTGTGLPGSRPKRRARTGIRESFGRIAACGFVRQSFRSPGRVPIRPIALLLPGDRLDEDLLTARLHKPVPAMEQLRRLTDLA